MGRRTHYFVWAALALAGCQGEPGPDGPQGEPGAKGTAGDGTDCWDLNDDGACSPGEDLNTSGGCDVAEDDTCHAAG